MRKNQVFIFVCCVVSSSYCTSCGDNAKAPGEREELSYGLDPAQSNGTQITISTRDEFLKLIPNVIWEKHSRNKGYCPKVSQDIIVQGEITFTAKDIEDALNAANVAFATGCDLDISPSCKADFRIAFENQQNGIMCDETDYDETFRYHFCKKNITIANTSIRLRGVLEDSHPSYPFFWHILDIRSSSTASCDKGQFLCSANNLCWSSFADYCHLCLAYETDRCACLSPAGNVTDGVACSFWVEADVQYSGKCIQGVCDGQNLAY